MAGWVATAANSPGSEVSTARTAAVSTGVDTGLRPEAASDDDPSRSAKRYGVRKLTPIRPTPDPPHTGPRRPDASSRRADTPTWFDGTTTVTGARGSSRLAAAMAAASATDASVP